MERMKCENIKAVSYLQRKLELQKNLQLHM